MLAALVACLAVALTCAPAAWAGDSFQPDSTPLPDDVTGGGSSSGASAADSATGMGTIVRGIVGLAIVLGVIYGLHWLLKNSNRGRKADRNDLVEVIATTPLAQNRSIHLVRAGDELILVGAAESGVTPLRVYASGEQFAAGIDGPEAQPVLELPAPPPLEEAEPTRGVVSTLKSWTVRT
jgi:flagellar protein FliO/FliZ